LIEPLDQYCFLSKLEVALSQHQIFRDVSAHQSVSAKFVVGCAAHHEILAVRNLG